MSFLRSFVLVISISVALIGNAQADIALTNSGANSTFFNNLNGQTVDPGAISFDLMGGNALVVMLSSESIDQYSVSFNGQNLIEAAHAENSGASGPAAPQDVGIFYLINPTSSSGNIMINGVSTTDGDAGLAYSYAALSSVASLAIFDPMGHEGSNSGNIALEHTNEGNGGFVFTNAVNNASNLGNSPSYVSGLASNELQRTFISQGGSGHLHHYGAVPVAGTFFETVNLPNSRDAFVVVGFNSVPEPTSCSLMGLLGCCLMVRRRR